ncbi:unnamed protein product [Mucor hiemalis]
MTLVAISYNPPNTTHSKWRKGLALLSSKLHTNKRYKNNTTRAAATEKILRHNANTPKSVVVKCEDLTAKEFAQMAGIKIKTSEEILDEDLSSSGSSYCNDEDNIYLTTKTTNTFNNNHQMTSISTTLSTKSCHQIWESDFWQCDNKSASNNDKLTKTNTTLSTTNNNDTLFISQLRSSSTALNTIQKGRFKIVVGQDDCEPVNQLQHQHHHVVLEWKRKRSDSSTVNTNKK